PGRRASLRARTVSIDSWRAASMNAHVLTTTTSASSGASAGTIPSASIVPVSLSESTWFFGQPRVSTQKECATKLKATGRPNLRYMATIETINPTTGKSIGSVPDMEDAPLRFTKRSYKVYEPLGVVAVISPWNYPFSLTMTNVVSALFAGNTVVLKPSEITPLVGVLVGELFDKGCDYADVVQVVTGGGAAGNALVGAGVQKVCFTGSVATGKKVMAKAAETLTPVTLELGGKDPMIVLD